MKYCRILALIDDNPSNTYQIKDELGYSKTRYVSGSVHELKSRGYIMQIGGKYQTTKLGRQFYKQYA